ncbi:hypothetical protein [Nostoc punctiforme]|uniref:hypothetical protein n=1 Tax=Nostoc punctiforme TaxID=272131 RepID=UPI000045BC5E|nr:hypothetical protein [Nostoc punctiforme]
MKLPAELFAQVFEQVIEKIQATPSVSKIPLQWQPIYQKFGAVWIADGSTLEELRKKLKALSEQKTVLAGKIMMMVEAFTNVPIKIWYTQDSKANHPDWNHYYTQRLGCSPGEISVSEIVSPDRKFIEKFLNVDCYVCAVVHISGTEVWDMLEP